MLRLVAYDIADKKRLRRVAKVCDRFGVRVEKLFPFNSPWIQAIKVVKHSPSWRTKLYTERTFCSHKAVRKLVKK